MIPPNQTAQAVAVVRVAVFGTWFLKVLATPVQLYADLPAELFARYGVLAVLPAELLGRVLASSLLLGVFKALLLVVCLLAAAGARGYRYWAVVAAILLLLFDGLMKGFNGFINHAQMGLLYAAFALALFPAESAGSAGSQRAGPPAARAGAPVVLMAVVLGLVYSFVGVRRLIVGGMGLYTGDAVATYFAVNALAPARSGFTLGFALAQSAPLVLLAKAGFAAITLAEVATPLCLLSRRVRLGWLAIMIPFHLSTLLLMNIFFWENLLLIVLIFTGLPAAIAARLHAHSSAGVAALSPQQETGG